MQLIGFPVSYDAAASDTAGLLDAAQEAVSVLVYARLDPRRCQGLPDCGACPCR